MKFWLCCDWLGVWGFLVGCLGDCAWWWFGGAWVVLVVYYSGLGCGVVLEFPGIFDFVWVGVVWILTVVVWRLGV